MNPVQTIVKSGISITLILFLSSCATSQKMGFQEDELSISRKYIGQFVDYRVTNDPVLLWIKTDNPDYGRISAFDNKCDFIPGERLYLRKKFLNPGGLAGYWVYQIEGSVSGAYYKLSDFQHDKKVPVQSWF